MKIQQNQLLWKNLDFKCRLIQLLHRSPVNRISTTWSILLTPKGHSFSAGQAHNCTFNNIKYRSNWVWVKGPKLQISGCLVHGDDLVRIPATTCLSFFSFTELNFFFFYLKCCTFFLKHILSTEAKSVRKSLTELKDVGILEANRQPWHDWHLLADLVCCEKFLKYNKHNSLHLVRVTGV